VVLLPLPVVLLPLPVVLMLLLKKPRKKKRKNLMM
jgi:hypothetical protein